MKHQKKKFQFDNLNDTVPDNIRELLARVAMEMDHLASLSAYMESIEDRLSELYKDKFPKICNSCGKVYRSRDDFLEYTDVLKKGSLIHDSWGLQEFRNCSCGSTLMIWLKDDRRDDSDFGILRRALFDTCFNKLKETSSLNESELKEFLRFAFRRIINKVSVRAK